MNKAIIIGRIGKDPEVMATKNGSTICKVTVATDDSYKDKNGNKVEKTDWHTVVGYNKLGEIMATYLKKGGLVSFEGKMKTDKYEKDGQTRYSFKIKADQMEMLGGKDYEGGKKEEPKAEPESDDDYGLDSIPF